MAEKERNDTNTGKSEGKQTSGKRILLRTFGCQMNVRDSEVIAGLLQAAGYKLTADSKEADVIIFNTCSVRQHAEDKVWSEIGRYKAKNKPLIGLVGCMAQNYKEKAFERSPGVDFVVGTKDIDKIPGIIKNLSKTALFERKIWETDGESRPEEIYHTGFHEDKEHSYVVISEGCSNYCSYCVVPYVRGEIQHRNYKDILKEIEEAVDKGITKVTLLGQNVCAYGAENGVGFVKLLEMVNGIKGLKEFSFITSHPRDTSRELFQAMQDCGKLKKCLHLPVQSGSDRILKLMNRGYTQKFYFDLADDYRKIVEGGALTTDIIVGFPTESEDDFRDTYGLVKNIEFDAAFIFKYSVRPNTAAAQFADDVDKKVKEERHRQILDLQRKISKGKRC